MRKSTREVQKRTLFHFEEQTNKTRVQYKEDVNGSPDTDEEEDLFDSKPVPKSKKSKAVPQMVPQQKKKNSEDSSASSLFETVKSSKKIGTEVLRWIESCKEDRITAVVELVNFILMSAGAKKQWVPQDVDLDALEPEELDELLSEMVGDMTSSEGSKLYPLNTTNKQARGSSFRDRYVTFWTHLAEELQSSEDQYVASKEGLGMLKIIIDQLVSLSSMAVVNVRDAVTEAALTIGQRAVACCVGLRARCDGSRRQLQAENNKKTPTTNVQKNPKYIAILRQSQRLDEALEGMEDLCSTVFNTVFVHRFKDSQETVRALCTRHIGDWLPLDPSRLFKDDYLKYIGWMCFDYSNAVRKEAVRSVGKLLKADGFTSHLSGFVERFIGRFVEIAVGDADDTVALEMMIVMRDLQMKGMIDNVDEESLDLVDEVIFDGGASRRVRQEALAFMMDHTEGFEDIEEEEELTALQKKGKKTKNTGEDTKAFARRQRTAMQLETLTEFAEHHLYGADSRCSILITENDGNGVITVKSPDLERIDMLVEACLDLPQGGIMRDWSTICALLLRESDELISSALRPTLSSILLRIFVASAVNLRDWYHLMRASQLEEVDGMKGKNSKKGQNCNNGNGNNGNGIRGYKLDGKDQIKAEQWEALNDHLLRELPSLLTRFRDDKMNLSVLVNVLSSCDISISSKACKGLLKSTVDFFELSSEERVVEALCGALREWTVSGGSSKGTVDFTVAALLFGLWTSIEDRFQNLKEINASIMSLNNEGNSEERRDKNSKNKNNKNKSKKSIQDYENEQEEILLFLNVSVMKYKKLWSMIDCRKLTDIDSNDITDFFIEIADITLTICDEKHETRNTGGNRNSGNVNHTDNHGNEELERICSSLSVNSIQIVQNILQWVTSDVYLKAKDINETDPQNENNNNNNEDDNENDEYDDNNEGKSSKNEKNKKNERNESNKERNEMELELSDSSDIVLVLREKLIDVLLVWLSLGETNSQGSEKSDSEVRDIHRTLQREAFSMIGTLRALYPLRNNQYIYVDKLAFSPSQDVLGGLRKVFELEGNRIKGDLKRCSDIIAFGEENNENEGNNNNNENNDRDRDNELNESNTRKAIRDTEKLTKLLINSLLLPLSNSMMYDIENLNRRQAAAVLCYYIDPSVMIQDSVKSLIKCLKDADIMKYLEVQMVALKGIYSENVVARINEKQQVEEDSGLHDYLEAERAASKAISDGYIIAISLAKKLVLTMGVGKAKGIALGATVNFFRAGIDVCLTQPEFIGFVRVLEPYLRLLPPANIHVVSDYFQEKLEGVEELLAVVEENDSNGDGELEALLDFRGQLLGKGRGRGGGGRRESGVDSDMSSQGSPDTSVRRRPAEGRSTGGPRGAGSKVQNQKVQGPSGGPSGPPGKGRKRHASILESVHEDEGDEEDDDDENIPSQAIYQQQKQQQSQSQQQQQKNKKPVKAPKNVPAPTLSQEGSRRSSRGEATKKISYANDNEKDEEEEEEEEEEENEGEEGNDDDDDNNYDNYNKNNINDTNNNKYNNNTYEEDDDEEVLESLKNLKAPSARSPSASVTYGGRKLSVEKKEEIEDERVKQKNVDKIAEKIMEKGRKVVEKVQKVVEKVPERSNTSRRGQEEGSRNSSVSRVNTVHLGLELEESADWVEEEEGEEEEEVVQKRGGRGSGGGVGAGGGLGGRGSRGAGGSGGGGRSGGGRGSDADDEESEEFYMDTNYTRKRGREPTRNTNQTNQAREDREEKEEKVKKNKKVKPSNDTKDTRPLSRPVPTRPLPTRTSQRTQSRSSQETNSQESQERSQSQSQSQSRSSRSRSAESSQDREEQEEEREEEEEVQEESQESEDLFADKDLFAGLAVPSRKRFR